MALTEIVPDTAFDLGGQELRIYEGKAAADLLRDAGFLNVTLGPFDGLDAQSISIEQMQLVDLGKGYQDKQRQVVVSDVVGGRLVDGALRLFHWDGFVSIIDPSDFSLTDQAVSR